VISRFGSLPYDGPAVEAPRFLVVLAAGLAAAAACLVLAAVLDAPALRLVAVAPIVGVLVAREAWTWRARGRVWLALLGLLLVVVVVAFAVERLGS
jgi:hypothetical protein